MSQLNQLNQPNQPIGLHDAESGVVNDYAYNMIDVLVCCDNDTPQCQDRKQCLAQFLEATLCPSFHCGTFIIYLPCLFPCLVILFLAFIYLIVTNPIYPF